MSPPTTSATSAWSGEPRISALAMYADRPMDMANVKDRCHNIGATYLLRDASRIILQPPNILALPAPPVLSTLPAAPRVSAILPPPASAPAPVCPRPASDLPMPTHDFRPKLPASSCRLPPAAFNTVVFEAAAWARQTFIVVAPVESGARMTLLVSEDCLGRSTRGICAVLGRLLLDIVYEYRWLIVLWVWCLIRLTLRWMRTKRASYPSSCSEDLLIEFAHMKQDASDNLKERQMKLSEQAIETSAPATDVKIDTESKEALFKDGEVPCGHDHKLYRHNNDTLADLNSANYDSLHGGVFSGLVPDLFRLWSQPTIVEATCERNSERLRLIKSRKTTSVEPKPAATLQLSPNSAIPSNPVPVGTIAASASVLPNNILRDSCTAGLKSGGRDSNTETETGSLELLGQELPKDTPNPARGDPSVFRADTRLGCTADWSESAAKETSTAICGCESLRRLRSFDSPGNVEKLDREVSATPIQSGIAPLRTNIPRMPGAVRLLAHALGAPNRTTGSRSHSTSQPSRPTVEEKRIDVQAEADKNFGPGESQTGNQETGKRLASGDRGYEASDGILDLASNINGSGESEPNGTEGKEQPNRGRYRNKHEWFFELRRKRKQDKQSTFAAASKEVCVAE
ncbi:hypothetical protein RhiJN_07225 [Ceratobasidium sp. AG-Ba]|nr:hypothetical protein RhiJN_07225 [Ceratobasidium sp. AG-Ba]QRW08096.1 hypothetical protein RhiLY_07095 [Ceratobasidium sp. AG-Ba]